MESRGSDRRVAVVLLSGGMDSATTLAWAIESKFAAHALTVGYGQRHAEEVARATRIAGQLGAASHRVVEIDLSFLRGSALTDRATPVPKRAAAPAGEATIPPTYVPARNTLFLSLALAWAETLGAFDLFIGANAVDYSGYPDCRPEFLQAFERLAGLATRAGAEAEAEGARFKIHAPLLAMTKAEIVREALRLGVDLASTLSCYDPDPLGHPCQQCDACHLRAKGFREAEIEDPSLSK